MELIFHGLKEVRTKALGLNNLSLPYYFFPEKKIVA
jgi:hypothetical protein